MGGRAAGFRTAVDGGVARLSPGSDWLTDFPDFGPTALRSPMWLFGTRQAIHFFESFQTLCSKLLFAGMESQQ